MTYYLTLCDKMRVTKLSECKEIIAGDKVRLRELVHPDRDSAFDGRYSIAYAVVAPGQSTIRHRLSNDEVYYILEGRGEMHVDEECADLEPGDLVEIPPGAVQWIRNPGETNLVFLCIVDPAWRAEDEEILE